MFISRAEIRTLFWTKIAKVRPQILEDLAPGERDAYARFVGDIHPDVLRVYRDGIEERQQILSLSDDLLTYYECRLATGKALEKAIIDLPQGGLSRYQAVAALWPTWRSLCEVSSDSSRELIRTLLEWQARYLLLGNKEANWPLDDALRMLRNEYEARFLFREFVDQTAPVKFFFDPHEAPRPFNVEHSPIASGDELKKELKSEFDRSLRGYRQQYGVRCNIATLHNHLEWLVLRQCSRLTVDNIAEDYHGDIDPRSIDRATNRVAAIIDLDLLKRPRGRPRSQNSR